MPSETNYNEVNNDMTNNTNATASAANNDDGSTKSFEMALSVVAALKETRRVALEEVHAIQAANPSNPFAPGMRSSQSVVEAMNETLKTLKPEIHKIARANNWALTKGW